MGCRRKLPIGTSLPRTFAISWISGWDGCVKPTRRRLPRRVIARKERLVRLLLDPPLDIGMHDVAKKQTLNRYIRCIVFTRDPQNESGPTRALSRPYRVPSNGSMSNRRWRSMTHPTCPAYFNGPEPVVDVDVEKQ